MVNNRIALLITIFIGFLCFFLPARANNLNLANGAIAGNMVTFEIGWENAWNLTENSGNHDAVWIFVKGQTTTGSWTHIDVEQNSTLHYTSSPLTVETVADGKGLFLLLQAQGYTNVEAAQVSVKTTVNLEEFRQIKIFGIEMVHIPQGPFYLGDGASVSSLANASGNPILVESEQEIDLTKIIIHNPNSEFSPAELPQLLPSGFPKGAESFYVMKYEVSQLQYVDFLNTLTYTQQKSRTSLPPSSPKGTFAMVNPYQPDSLYRNGIVIMEPGVESSKPARYAMDYNKNQQYNDNNDGLHRASNFMNWGDLSAYLDWAALRPITELEFEKLSRGKNATPIAGEFAWGTATVSNANNPTNDGTIFESVSDVPQSEGGLANHGTFIATEGWGLRGVLRTGFAANENTNRIQAGATYYGVMEISGNVWEQTIMVAGGGENFEKIFGDGMLSENGDANVQTWCNPSTASGVLLKGGGWQSTISSVGSWRDLAISDRFYSHLKPASRRNSIGGRGGR